MLLLHAKSRILHWTHCTKNIKMSVKKLSVPLEFCAASVLQCVVRSSTQRGCTRCCQTTARNLSCVSRGSYEGLQTVLSCTILWVKCKQPHVNANLCQLKLYLLIHFTRKFCTFLPSHLIPADYPSPNKAPQQLLWDSTSTCIPFQLFL